MDGKMSFESHIKYIKEKELNKTKPLMWIM